MSSYLLLLLEIELFLVLILVVEMGLEDNFVFLMFMSDISSDIFDFIFLFSFSDSSSGSDSGNDRIDMIMFYGRLVDDVELKVKLDELFRIRYYG